jgi:dienelactone hydrolase
MRYLAPCLLLVGLLLLTACADAPDAAQTADTPEAAPMEPAVHAEAVDYTAGDVTLKGYLAYDENKEGPRPGVLVVHEWWGHTEYARRRARMLAELGYTALAVDMYGDGKTANHPDDAGAFANAVMSNMDVGQQRFEAALAVLKNHPTTDPEQVAAIGYCFGGAVVLHMARRGLDLDGVVSFHGALNTQAPAQPGMVNAPILVLHGADDQFVPQEVVDQFRQEMDAAGATYEFIAYPGAMHSFTNPEADSLAEAFQMPVSYNAAADAQSWEAMQNFFEMIFE